MAGVTATRSASKPITIDVAGAGAALASSKSRIKAVEVFVDSLVKHGVKRSLIRTALPALFDQTRSSDVNFSAIVSRHFGKDGDMFDPKAVNYDETLGKVLEELGCGSLMDLLDGHDHE